MEGKPCLDCHKGTINPDTPLPLLSLCINSHNEGPDLLATILSFRKAYSGPFEAVVVDDASTDDSIGRVIDYCDRQWLVNQWIPKYGKPYAADGILGLRFVGWNSNSPPADLCIPRPAPHKPRTDEREASQSPDIGSGDEWLHDLLDWVAEHALTPEQAQENEDLGEGDDETFRDRMGYIARYLDDNAWVKIIHNDSRVGCGKAKTQAVAAARGEVIIHADGHCRVLRGSLDVMARFAAQVPCVLAPGVAPLHCKMDEVPDETIPFKGGSCSYGGFIAITHKGCKVDSKWKPKDATARRTATWFAIFMVGRKTLLERLGGWNEYAGCWGSQEIGLALRAWFADVPIYAIRDVVCGHRYQDDSQYKAYAPREQTHYPTKKRETGANAIYAHSVVFDEVTLEEVWRPLWRTAYHGGRYDEANALNEQSALARQSAEFKAKCKRRTDAEFWATFGKPVAPVTPIPCEDITAVLLQYKRPVNGQKCVDAIKAGGIKNIWQWCQLGCAPSNGVSRVFTDTANASTWGRYAIAALVETPWILFCDDDVELTPEGLLALREGAARYLGRNLGLIGATFLAPFNSYRQRQFYHADKIKEATEVDMLWPKGQLIPRDMARKIFADVEVWDTMRAAVGSTSGDDFVAVVAQARAGFPPALVVPASGCPYPPNLVVSARGRMYLEHHAEGKEHALTKLPGRYDKKKATFGGYRALGWKPIGMKNPPAFKHLTFEERVKRAADIGTDIAQHPEEARKVWDAIDKLRPQVFVEIGSAAGGTLYLYAGACEQGATIIALDDGTRQESRIKLRRVLSALEAEGYNVRWIRGDSHSPEIKAALLDALDGDAIDALHIDGDHSFAGVKADYVNFAHFVRPGGLIAFHDIAQHFSDCRVEDFWAELKTTTALRDELIITTPLKEARAKASKPWAIPHGKGGLGVGLIWKPQATDILAVFTPFGMGRPWAVDLWAKNIRKLGAPHGTRFIVVDNTNEPATSAAIAATLPKVATEAGGDIVLLSAQMPKRDKGVGALRARMADLWELAMPHLDGAGRLLSIESDVEVPDGALARLTEHLKDGRVAMAAAACKRRREKTELVVNPRSMTGIAEADAVHLGCTLLDVPALNAVWPAAQKLDGQLDEAISNALRAAGKRVLYDWGLRAKHYTTATEFVT